MVITEPGPKSFTEVEFAPVYQIPLMITFVISLLCKWSAKGHHERRLAFLLRHTLLSENGPYKTRAYS